MTLQNKILEQVLTLKALHQEGLEKATAIAEMIQGEGATSPKNRKRLEKSGKAIARRNIQLRRNKIL